MAETRFTAKILLKKRLLETRLIILKVLAIMLFKIIPHNMLITVFCKFR